MKDFVDEHNLWASIVSVVKSKLPAKELDMNRHMLSLDSHKVANNNNYYYWLQHPGNGVLGDVLRVRLIWEPYGSQALCRPCPPNPSPPVFFLYKIFQASSIGVMLVLRLLCIWYGTACRYL
jgi:hypothetical protein